MASDDSPAAMAESVSSEPVATESVAIASNAELAERADGEADQKRKCCASTRWAMIELVKSQQALGLIDVLQSRIEELEKDDCQCRIGALQDGIDALENHECSRARSLQNE